MNLVTKKAPLFLVKKLVLSTGRIRWPGKAARITGGVFFFSNVVLSTTLPETNIAPENRPLEVWRFLLETTIFRGYVGFREGNG